MRGAFLWTSLFGDKQRRNNILAKISFTSSLCARGPAPISRAPEQTWFSVFHDPSRAITLDKEKKALSKRFWIAPIYAYDWTTSLYSQRLVGTLWHAVSQLWTWDFAPLDGGFWICSDPRVLITTPSPWGHWVWNYSGGDSMQVSALGKAQPKAMHLTMQPCCSPSINVTAGRSWDLSARLVLPSCQQHKSAPSSFVSIETSLLSAKGQQRALFICSCPLA